MRRREFITLVGGAASTWPFAASAQAPLRRPLIGFLAAGSKPETEQYYSGFLQGMHEFGYVDDRAYAVEVRYADGDSNRLLELAQELLHREPDVIVADSTPGTLAAKHATASVPIVGINMTNPVGLGLVESEARPGTNVTGTLIRVQGLAGKLLEIGLDLVPGVNKIGALVNPGNPSNAVQRREAESAAAKLGVSFAPIEVRTVNELGPAFQTFARDGANTSAVLSLRHFRLARWCVLYPLAGGADDSGAAHLDRLGPPAGRVAGSFSRNRRVLFSEVAALFLASPRSFSRNRRVLFRQ